MNTSLDRRALLRQASALAGAGALGTLGLAPAQAQSTWPSKPVKPRRPSASCSRRWI